MKPPAHRGPRRSRPARPVLLAAAAAALLVLLSGCLEVEQHPRWRNGVYDGKTDQLPSQSLTHGSRLAWNALIDNRTRLQNEYGRTGRPKGEGR